MPVAEENLVNEDRKAWLHVRGKIKASFLYVKCKFVTGAYAEV